MGQKEQKISVWYQGSMDEIIQKAAFGDISLNLPNTRFLNMNRNLFGAEVTARLGDLNSLHSVPELKALKRRGRPEVNQEKQAVESAQGSWILTI